jgi:hypothetical protein
MKSLKVWYLFAGQASFTLVLIQRLYRKISRPPHYLEAISKSLWRKFCGLLLKSA